MNRLALFIAGGLVLAAAPGCQSPKCGPGTQLQQQANGDVLCVAVAVTKGETECDADGGVMLRDGNKCVSDTQCGPGTTRDATSHECVPLQQVAHEPPVCATPSSGHVCIHGTVRHLVDGSYLAGETVHLRLFAPTDFVGDSNPSPRAELDASDTFIFDNLATPGQYVMILVGDAAAAPGSYRTAGVSGPVSDGHSLRIDAWALKAADYAAWALPASFDSQGALFYRFFNDPAPPDDAHTPTETHPLAGITLIDGNTKATAAGAQYLGATLAAVDDAASVTDASGGVLVTTTNQFGATYTGSGGGITWQGKQGLPLPHVVQVDFFHPTP